MNQQLRHLGSAAGSEGLVKSDTTLAAICHGLLLQREALGTALKDLDDRHPRAVQDIQRLVVDPTSSFRAISDDLLQYTCGRRAETIEARRKTFRPRSEYMSSLPYAVPPSSTHLFDDPALSELLRSQPDLFFRDLSRPRQQQSKHVNFNPKIGGLKSQPPPLNPNPPLKRLRLGESEDRQLLTRAKIEAPLAKAGSGPEEVTGFAARRNDYGPAGFKGGRLQHFLSNWEQVQVPEGILKVISKGYTLPFVTRPPLIAFSPNLLKKFAFPGLEKEIVKLLEQEVVEGSPFPSGFLA